MLERQMAETVEKYSMISPEYKLSKFEYFIHFICYLKVLFEYFYIFCAYKIHFWFLDLILSLAASLNFIF